MPFNTRVTWAELQYTSVSELPTGQSYSVTHLEIATTTDAHSASVGAYVPQTHTHTILEIATATDAHSSVNIPVVTLTGSWTMPSTRPTSVEVGARVADHTAMATGADLVTVTYPVTAYRYNNAGTQTFDLVQTITKAKSGTDAKVLSLSATAQQFTFGSDDQPKPTSQTITFTANLQNLAGPAVWTARRFNLAGTELTAATLTGTGNTRTLTVAAFGNDAARCEVTASYGGYSDTITVIALEEGVNGGGQNLLSNSNFKNGKGGWGTWASYTGAVPNPEPWWGGLSSGPLPEWTLAGANCLALREVGVRPANTIADMVMASEPSGLVPVKAGERLDVSVYYTAHRCTGTLTVWFYDANQQYIGEMPVANMPEYADYTNFATRLPYYARATAFVTVPTSFVVDGVTRYVANAHLGIRKASTLAGNGDSWIIATMFYMGRATATQQTNAPWSDGTLRHVNTEDIVDDAATAVLVGYDAGNNFANSPSGNGIFYEISKVSVPPPKSGEYTVNVTATVPGSINFTGDATVLENWCYAVLNVSGQNLIGIGNLAAIYRRIATVNNSVKSDQGTATLQMEFGIQPTSSNIFVWLDIGKTVYCSGTYSDARVRVEIIKK